MSFFFLIFTLKDKVFYVAENHLTLKVTEPKVYVKWKDLETHQWKKLVILLIFIQDCAWVFSEWTKSQMTPTLMHPTRTAFQKTPGKWNVWRQMTNQSRGDVPKRENKQTTWRDIKTYLIKLTLWGKNKATILLAHKWCSYVYLLCGVLIQNCMSSVRRNRRHTWDRKHCTTVLLRIVFIL